MYSFAVFVILAALRLQSAYGAGFTVSGNQILDANGNAFVMRGINQAHTWYKSDIDTAMQSIVAAGVNTVRIVLSDGQVWTLDDADSIMHILNLCEQYKVVCVIDQHDSMSQNDISYLENAVDRWVELFSYLDGTEDKVIINIANEWYTQHDADFWAEAYKAAIPKLRAAGYKHLLVIDCAGWGQYVEETCIAKGQEIIATDTLKNTAFSIHMYDTAGRTEDTIKTNIDGSLNAGLAIMIGEWGQQNVAVDYLMSYTKEKSIGWIAWSWYGNTDSNFDDLASGADGAYLTSWGERVVNGENGIKQTAQTASVFQ